MTPFKALSNDWDANIEYEWARRAVNLKRRGTYIVRTHGKTHNRAWKFAFDCYSRALQLVSLAYWASRTCSSKADDTLENKEFNDVEIDAEKCFDYIDLDNLIDLNNEDVEKKVNFIPRNNYIRLQFM